MGLSFDHLREVNSVRCVESFGHTLDRTDPEAWSLAEWGCALAGEAGELANLCKKVRRGDLSLDSMKDHMRIADEAADVAIYLDILTAFAGINLGEAVRKKFNETSLKRKYLGTLEPR